MRKIGSLGIALVLIGWTLSSTTAKGQVGGLTVLGAGASSCAKYLADTQSAPAYQGVYSNWALGYITALNVINSGKPGSKMMADATGLDNRIKNFCLTNQAKSYSDAVTAVALEFFR